MVRETRHLWVGNLPENVREEKIIEHFKRYGRVESVKVLPKRGSEGGVAAFVDFVDIKSAQKAHNAINKMGDRDLRTDYNEPGTIPSAARGLDDSLSLGSRGRDVSGFTRAAGGAVYGPPTSLHSRDGRYERRLDGTTESRDRAYDHSAYGHHERPGSSFERQRHYETDYYRDARERTLSTAGSGSGTSSGSGTTVSSGVVGTIVSAVAGNTGTGGSAGATTGGSGGSTSSGVGFYRSHSRSPCRFETPEPRYESRAREPFTLASVVHRDLYREDRGRRGERSYRHSRSRSPHSSHSRNPSPQRLASQATRPPRSHSGSGSRSRSSSSDSVSSTSSSTSGSDSSSSSSDDSPARSVQSAAVPAPSALPLSSLDKDEPRKSFGIKVQNLPVRSTDTSLKDGLFHEFKKHGKVTSVQIHGASEERYGLVFFRQQEDQEKALGASKGKLFFGMQIDVTAWNGPETESENEFRPLDERIDEFHPKATRTLFIGNLEKTTTYHDLLNIFQRFGEIVDIDIKKVNGAPQYAFLQYCDIASVCKAIKKMDGEYLGNNRLKVDFANQESQMAFYRSMQASGQDIRDFYDILSERSCSDKDKVELAPRPIPSWYMKKKKIRTDSDEKLHDKKEELKPQDQERQDLFASRFLHSSIFEQDSRRLQHLERKDQDLETGVGRPFAKPGATEAQPESGIGDIPQEPIVLFHSRFLELQQQKDKDHAPADTENDSMGVEIKRDEVQNCDNVVSDKVPEPVLKIDDKSVSPPLPWSQFVPSPKEVFSPEKKELLTPSSDQPVSFVKEEKVEQVPEVSPSHSFPMEDIKPIAPKLMITPPVVLPEPENEVETKVELIEPKVKIGDSLVVEHNPLVEDKPPTPGGSLCGFERETAEFTYSDYPKIEEKSEIVMIESKVENQETKHSEESQKTETDSEVCMPELEAEIKALPNRRQPKSKRAKPLSVLRASQPSQIVATEKPATRKSERIDREKLKRASSPRAEVPKVSFESKTTSKSPVHASDSEQNLESSLIHGRTRRRNVRSVYAKLHEDDQAGKEVVESSRSMRKRGADKEPTQQDVQIPPTIARRGRPPKRGLKRGEDISPVKVDQQKIVEEDTEVKESSTTVEVVKASEGWRSPRTQKVQQTQLTSSAPVNKKGSRIDKQPGSTSVLSEQADLSSHDESELKPKSDSELFGNIPETAENTSSPLHRKERDLKDSVGKKSTDGDIEKVDTSCSERRQQPEKSVKVKSPRLKRNTKQATEDKSHSLKNLEIRVSVDDVKGLLRSEDDEPESFEAPTITKTKTVVQENDEAKIVGFSKESKESGTQEKEDVSSEPELPSDPAALLARQMELEQAVENIAKLTVEQPPRPYKEPPSEQPTILPPVIVEPESEVEEEKRANPASETELAAAIDSITAEEMCADGDGFTAAPTYTALIPTPDSVVSPSSNEIMEPETHMVINNILAADSDDGPLTPSPKGVMAESKAPEDIPIIETPKKTGKVRAKTPKKSRSRKGAAAKKGDTAEEVSQPEPSPVKLPESIPEDPETINLKAVTVTAGVTAATSVVTAVATCRRDVTSAITVDTPKEAEQPEVEQPVPKESAFHSGTSNSSCKKHPQAAEPSTPTLAPAPSRPQPVSQFSVPLLRPAKMPLSPEWPPRTEESRIYVAPSCHVTMVTPSAPASTTLGTPSTNPPMPPDTKASDIDPSSSTLRKILMEPKYVSASNSNSIPTTMVTSVLSEPSRMSENENPSDTLGSRPLHPEERPPLPPQPMHHKPFPLTESQQNCGEKTQHTVISPTTSVISRIPMPYDTEETPRISLSNRSMGLSIPKQKFRSNSNENNRYHGMDIVEDGTRGRSVVETTPYSTGASPGLRVNTSEGVVVLSYSGQKTEGPHRMRAKISQIPQASAGDIEFQQSVSKSSIKQDPLITSSQSPTPKVAPTSTAYGHTGVLLTGQSYNSQPVISSTKQESLGCDKSEAPYHTASQGGVVKMFQQPVSSPQVLMYNQAVIQQQHGKRGLGTEPLPKKMDIGKAVQQSNLSPVMSPHHPSLSGSRMSPSPGITTDRSALHLKQEPQSPRTSVHSPSPFVKACPPSSSPRATSVVLSHGMPPMSTYHSSMHHPHSEQSSVIIQPHSVTQSMAHEARMNTPPVSGINYGRRGDSMSSPHPGPPQRSNTPQPNVIRDLVLQSHSSPQGSVSGGSSSSASEEDPRHFNQALSRPSVTQLQSDVMMIHSDHRGLHPSIRSMDQYRDMHQRILMHQQLGEQAAVEARQSRNSETGTTSSINISGPSKSPIVGKSLELSTKESLKPLEGKLIHPPSNESRIRGVHASSPVMVSPHPHGVQLMHPGSAGSFPVYRDMRGFPSQFPGHPSSGHNLANQGVTSSQVPQEPELGHRSKMSQSHGGGSDSKPESSHLRHATSTDLSHISRIQGDTVSPSYQSPMTSPMALTHKPDLSLQKGPPAFLSTPPPTVPPSSSLQPRPEAKLEHTGHRSIDMVQLLTKYPIVWQGLLALKNDQAAVQLHFVSGNTILAQRSLPPPEGGPLLRIVQRMRLEASQLDSVARRMTVENDYCLLLALPCGRDQEDVLGQTQALKSGFITYLQAKQAAGIINVPNPGSNQPAYVVQIFPPCEFSESHLSRLAPDLLNSISSISPHLMIVIASV
ncbi:Msx2-interacting protein SMART/HDAC1-associated repressor protein SPEN -like protein [Collichthys lucidus]|uniref:Msx2-interacting protein n=1 Tax=Collichthys lucidus TaxID=240159 RepID=A0A4V6AQF9_COLLU|nr:Msx2-interacting protein SMART/HDAC1-associated repressor protein SPEN -like protein [Collichthys lucidus]